MAGFIFGLIFLVAGIICAIVFYNHVTTNVNDDYNNNYNNNYNKNNSNDSLRKPLKKFSWLSMGLGVFMCVLLTFFGCIASVDTGSTGVVTTFGKVNDYTYESGFHLKKPWDKVIEMDNRVQKITIDLSCFSSDIQEVNMRYTLNYQIDKANAQEIYKTVGKDYYKTIIEPTIAESVKVATAQFTAEKLVQTRTELATSIENLLTESLLKYNIKVSSTAIEDMDFTDSFTNAVEAKQVAEQKKKQAIIEQEQAKLQAENEAEIAKVKASADKEVAKTQAEAEAEVVKIQAEAAEFQGKKEAAIALQRLASINGWTVITDMDSGINKLYKANGEEVTSDELIAGTKRLIEYYYTQTWDGVLPETYVGGNNNGDGNGLSAILIG